MTAQHCGYTNITDLYTYIRNGYNGSLLYEDLLHLLSSLEYITSIPYISLLWKEFVLGVRYLAAVHLIIWELLSF